ncbi:DUF2236 domain containing protein [Streptomyces azureus]|uniref:DUF2236 domain containing protein n=1 Tax=Streptomyces azureus TaxID=146537 RepID=A0A0K8PV73_STRAJ|nr:DUF2236 domain containing protein [Streptomyces azureus]
MTRAHAGDPVGHSRQGRTHLLGILETIADRSPFGAWALDRLGHLTTVLELSSLTRGRVMHYAIPEQLRKDYGISSTAPRGHRWTPPAATVS